MFVFSCKTTKTQLTCIALCAVLLVGMLSAAFWRDSTVSVAKVTTADEGISYLKSYGYTATGGEKEELQVPDTADSTLTTYAEIAGIDLTPLLGKKIERRTYTITDHPDGTATAHLYLYKNNVLAGTLTVNGKLYPLLKDGHNGTAG